jgi:hypothetical protein
MSENRNRNSGSLLDPFLATGGIVPYGAGLSVLTANPAAGGQYVPYFGSHGKPVSISSSVVNEIRNASMALERVPRQAPQLVPGQFGYAPNSLHLKGNSAVVDYANELRARHGWKVSNIQMGLSGPGYGVNLQPIPNSHGSVQVDQNHRLWSPWSGNTDYSNEIKARNEISGRSQARQPARYGELIAARNALSANARLVGRALQAGGPAFQVGGALVDHHLTQQEVQRHLAQGDSYGAGLANARLVGRQTGSVLGGAAVGAMLLGGAGAAGGLVVPGAGTVLLGTGGVLAGGLAGAILGEEAMRRLYAQWMGTPASGGSRTVGTPANQSTNDSFYPASGPAP